MEILSDKQRRREFVEKIRGKIDSLADKNVKKNNNEKKTINKHK